MARPKRLDVNGEVFYDIDTMCEKIEDYLQECDIPVLKECCLINGWNYEYVQQLRNKEGNEKLYRAIRRILDYKEVELEKGALTGKLEKTMAIFSLKQLGWRDKTEEKEESKENAVADILLNMIGYNNGSNK